MSVSASTKHEPQTTSYGRKGSNTHTHTHTHTHKTRSRCGGARKAVCFLLLTAFHFLSVLLLFLLSAVPWGPFSNSSSLSLIFADSFVRNHVLSRVSSSMRAIQTAIQLMEAFQGDFIGTDQHLTQKEAAPLGTPNKLEATNQQVRNKKLCVAFPRNQHLYWARFLLACFLLLVCSLASGCEFPRP